MKYLLILLLFPMFSFAYKSVNVKNHGCFYFPDEMTEGEMSKVIEKTIVKYNIKSLCPESNSSYKTKPLLPPLMIINDEIKPCHYLGNILDCD